MNLSHRFSNCGARVVCMRNTYIEQNMDADKIHILERILLVEMFYLPLSTGTGSEL
jgi:hypothetical protein